MVFARIQNPQGSARLRRRMLDSSVYGLEPIPLGRQNGSPQLVARPLHCRLQVMGDRAKPQGPKVQYIIRNCPGGSEACFRLRLIFAFSLNPFSSILPAMRCRRLARERAIQFLFQHEMNPPEAIEEELDRFWKSQTSAIITVAITLPRCSCCS